MHIERYVYPNNRLVGWKNAGLSPWAGLEDEIDQLVSSTFAALNATQPGRQFAVGLYQDRENAYVRAELPGLNRDEINVEMVDGNLQISAARKQPRNGSEESFSVSRTIGIPDDVHPDRVSAAYENGILTVTLPKREEAKPKKVNVAIK
jgi:HSP20 family protein